MMEKLRKLVVSAGVLSRVLVVVRRVFQRQQQLVQELEDGMEEETSSVKKKATLVDLFLEKVEVMIRDPAVAKSYNLPYRLSQYLAYTELVVARVRAETTSAKQWKVFGLKDYEMPGPTQIDTEGYTLRNKLKKQLKEAGLVSNVQTEAWDDSIWFRVAAVKKTKNRVRDQERLERGRSHQLVYYPGEPYLYSAISLSSEMASAVARCVGAEGWEALPLTGRCVSSLRRLRLARDAREGPGSKAKLCGERFAIVAREEDMEVEVAVPAIAAAPRLDRVEVTCSAEQQAGDVRLDFRLEVVGPDVIRGVQELSELGVVSSQPPPTWLQNLTTAGKNKFNLLESGREADQESNLSRMTELTISLNDRAKRK